MSNKITAWAPVHDKGKGRILIQYIKRTRHEANDVFGTDLAHYKRTGLKICKVEIKVKP